MLRNLHELSVAEMTDDELQDFYETCELAAMAWLAPTALAGDIDRDEAADAWMRKAERARLELSRRMGRPAIPRTLTVECDSGR